MAAFEKPGFVVAIVKDGKVIREMSENSERVVRLPFGSEYSIRLINKSGRRAYATVKVDGTEILSGKLVLSRYDKVDVERFMLNGDTKEGQKLKFVSAKSPNVQDPTAGDNGLIEVVFEAEAEDYLSATSRMLRGMSGSFKSSESGSTLTASSLCTNASTNAYYSASASPIAHVNSDVGATVGGNTSHQGFQYVNTYFPTDAPVTIGLRLKGMVEQPVFGCGESRKPYVVTNQSGKLTVDVNGTIIGGMEAVEITGTHLVLKVPMDLVQIGWFK